MVEHISANAAYDPFTIGILPGTPGRDLDFFNAHVIDAILEYARLEAGTETPERRSFALDALIEAAIDLMRPQAEAKGLQLDADIDTSVATSVLGDPIRLNRVLLNLLGNAIKFTAHGHIHLQATLEVIGSCPCDDGCPSCVQSPKCGNGNEPLDKRGAALLLRTVLAAGGTRGE